MSSVTVNAQQRLFVLEGSKGCGCLGFDVVFHRLHQFATKLGLALPKTEDIGTVEQYAKYREAEAAYIATSPIETFFEYGTPAEVQTVLESCRLNERKVRLFYGDAQTGRDWLEEHDVLGFVRRSSGPIRVPILVHKRSRGGPSILTASILRILDATTRKELYRHSLYLVPQFTIEPNPDYGFSIKTEDGQVQARAYTKPRAESWVAFMQGLRMAM